MDTILQTAHLKKVFPRKDGEDIVAVDDVTFSLQKGEKLAIIGESGSGKTTVARMIAHLLEPTAGQVMLAGEDITNAGGAKLKEVYSPRGSFSRSGPECRWSFKIPWTVLTRAVH